MKQVQPTAVVLVGPPHERRAMVVAALCALAENAATRWQDPAVLAGLLWRGGRVFAMAGDLRQAERRWAQAAEINGERLRAAGPNTGELADLAVEQRSSERWWSKSNSSNDFRAGKTG